MLALVWVNVDASSYDDLWSTVLSIQIGDAGIALDLRGWVNSGLMTFFFFVLGLEARREFDLGEFRERRRSALPVLAGIGGMTCAIGIYLAFNAGRPSAHGWAVAMSTDTAFALGMLALVGPRFPDRLRAWMLTVVVVDDILALVVIATVYTEDVRMSALLVALGLFAALVAARFLGVQSGSSARCSARRSGSRSSSRASSRSSPAWRSACSRTRIRPAGPTSSRRPSDSALFREQPTPELARLASRGVRSAVSPNERLQQLFHPWTSYVIVPLFALANAGIVINGDFLTQRVQLGDHARHRRRLRRRQAGRASSARPGW